MPFLQSSEECLRTSPVRTGSSLSEGFIFLFRSAISVTAVFVAKGHIFIFLPGQLQADATMVQTAHIYWVRRVCAVVLLLVLDALGIMCRDGADSDDKWYAIQYMELQVAAVQCYWTRQFPNISGFTFSGMLTMEYPPRSVLLLHHLEGNNNLFWGLRLRLYKLHHAIIHEFFNHSRTASVSRLRQCGGAAPCRSPKMQVVVSTDGMHWVRVHSRSCSRTYTQQLPTRCDYYYFDHPLKRDILSFFLQKVSNDELQH